MLKEREREREKKQNFKSLRSYLVVVVIITVYSFFSSTSNTNIILYGALSRNEEIKLILKQFFRYRYLFI